MTTETVVTEKKHTRILADGEVYAVRVGDKWFSYFDEERRTFVSNIQHCVTRAEANEIAKKVGEHARVVPVRAGDLAFWVRKTHHEGFSERTIRIGPTVRPRQDGIPDWFLRAMMDFAPERDGWDDEGPQNRLYALDVFSMASSGHWMDHTGWSGEGEDSVFISEPYWLKQDDIEGLIETCRKFGFKFQMTGQSSHYPSATLRIMISPKGQHEQTY